MILKDDNLIDEKLAKIFPTSVIENIKYGVIGYLGMNINENPDTDVDLKIYYDDQYSINNYKDKIECPLLDKFFNDFKSEYFEIVRDKENIDLSRYNIKFVKRTDEYMNNLFSFLSQNVSFFDKYKEEILKQSTMQLTNKPNYTYASLYILGIINQNDAVKKLKCYWITKHRNMQKDESDAYFLKFYEQNGIEKIKQLLPLVKNALINCQANLWMQGIDYNANTSEKHKIYLDSPQNLYDGLEKTFADYETLKQKILLIKDWHAKHPEFYCEGFALGKDDNSQLTFNIYFKLQLSKFSKLIQRIAQKNVK